MFIAASRTAQVRNPLALDAQYRARLDARRNLKIDRTVEGWYLNGVAERRLDERDRDLDEDIVAAPLKELVRTDEDVYIEVAVRAAAHARLAAARNADALSVVHTARNVDLDGLCNALASRAVAVRAGGLDNLSRAVAPAACT